MTVGPVLVLNAGSSTLKWVVLDSASEAVVQRGQASWHGSDATRHQAELQAALERVPEVAAVGHRVVHGGARFREPILIDEGVRQEIVALADLAPLHNMAAVAGFDAARGRFPNVPQVAAFDTAFHSTLPEATATYALPWEWTTRFGLRRFGFHGLSVEYAVGRAADMLGARPSRAVVCHLGAGCSVTALADGRSIDTTMGFTPLEGVMMARRSGSVDPGLLLHLLRHGLTVEALARGLNEESGLYGVSGVSGDMREVLARVDAGDPRARLAHEIFVQRVVSTIGAMTATLGGLDTVIFTGGIGEHSARTRAAVCARLGYFGVQLDEAANAQRQSDTDVAAPESMVRVLVIEAREDLTILRQVGAVVILRREHDDN